MELTLQSQLSGLLAFLARNPVIILLSVPPSILILWYLVPLFTSPLQKYPGPLLASTTNYWRMYHSYGGSMHLVTKRLHDRYGPVVRMGPNYIDLDFPSLIKTCFDTRGEWRKTEWHGVSGVKIGDKIHYNIFSECDPHAHARIKRPISKYWTTSGVSVMEPHIDSVLAFLVKRIGDSFSGEKEMGKAFNFGEWAMFYSWDVVAKSTCSKRIGYLEHGYDFDGTLSTSEKAMDYLVLIGMQPQLDKLFDKNPVYRIGPPAYGNVTQIGLGHLMARITGKDGHDPMKPDFMDRYLEAKQAYPDIVDDPTLLGYLLVNLAAGADTTAVSLKSVFYLSLKHPQVWKRLTEDIWSAKFTQIPVPYAEARSIPYLEAVIRECLRLYPGNCYAQERYVPKGGLALPDGSVVPEGTAVGFNAYILHRNRSIWGEDAEEFRPERWFQGKDETDEQFAERLRLMNNCDLSFGGGSRRCIGMNLGMMEVYKSVATLLAFFDWELDDQDKEWTIHNSIFPRQSGIILRCKRRNDLEAPFMEELATDE